MDCISWSHVAMCRLCPRVWRATQPPRRYIIYGKWALWGRARAVFNKRERRSFSLEREGGREKPTKPYLVIKEHRVGFGVVSLAAGLALFQASCSLPVLVSVFQCFSVVVQTKWRDIDSRWSLLRAITNIAPTPQRHSNGQAERGDVKVFNQ